MKRLFFMILIIALNLGLLSWTIAQGTRSDLFDLRRAQQELEIMKGILNTTLEFAARDILARGEAAESHSTGYREAEVLHSWGGGSITAFYLYGQGATFLIPTGRFRAGRMGRDLASTYGTYLVAEGAYGEAMDSLRDVLEEEKEVQHMLQEEMEEVARVQAEAAIAGAPAPPAPPALPKPAAQAKAAPKPIPEPRQKLTTEEMRKKVAEAQEKMKQRRAETEQRRQKFLEALGQVKVQLVEVLANHGDSLSFVKPGEYVNLVLTTDEGDAFLTGSRGGRREIISVQRSAVSDYKAGRLTLEAFKQKVLQYTN